MYEELAVIDIESTGFSTEDRICEIGIVTVDADTLTPIDEFASVVNPERDTGPVWIHGITTEMASKAPRFSQIQVEIAERLNGRVLVAHNLLFDERFLKQEWARCGVRFYPGEGICTLSLTKEKLAHAAQRFGIATNNMYSALGDARVTVELLTMLDGARDWCQPAIVESEMPPKQLQAHARPIPPHIEVSTLSALIAEAQFPSDDENVLAYFDKLDEAMEDLVLTEVESQELAQLRWTMGISPEDAIEAHEAFLRAVIAAAEADHVITPAEYRVLTAIAYVLDCETAEIPEVSGFSPESGQFLRETRIVASGEPFDVDGKPISRGEFRARCHAKGIVHISAVGPKCDVLVLDGLHLHAEEVAEAERLGVPVLTYADFVGQYGV